MFDMLSKLGEMQSKMEEIKQKLDGIEVNAASPNDKVKVRMTANKSIKEINIAEELLNPANKDELEDMLILAFNKAIENAENVSQAETQSLASGIIPNIPGLFK